MSDLFKAQLQALGLDDPDTPPSAQGWRSLLGSMAEGENDAPQTEERLPGFDAVAETLDAMVFLVDAAGTVLRANPAGEKALAALEAEGALVVSRALADAQGAEEPDLLADLAEAIDDNVTPMRGHLGDIGALPGQGPFSYSIVPIQIDAAAGAVVVVHDLTHQADMEERVRHAQEEAGSAERTRTQFVANTSHELRTPLNGIIGMTDLLLDTDLDEEQREFAELVQSSGEALLSLVNDILDFAKLEAGRFDLEIIDFDLTKLVFDAVDLLATKARDKGLELVVDLPLDVPRALLGDPGRVRQILTNLLSNAVKFTDEGDIVVSVARVDLAEGTPGLRMEVRDSGIGIADHARDRLFEPFAQADSSTTRRFGGTGLGLAISKQIVAMMGGDIGVESVAGEGSAFWFTFRLDAQPRVRSTTGMVRIPAEIAGCHILLVDDNAAVLRVAVALLEQLGARAVTVDDGQDVLQVLEEAEAQGDPFALVLMDLDMRGMDARAIIDAMASRPALDHVHRIVMAPVVSLRELDDGEKRRIGALLTKPLRATHVLTVLNKVLGREPTHSDLQAIVDEGDGDEPAATPFRPLLLVAEDNPVNQKVAVRLLAKLGYETHVVGDGAAALAEAQKPEYAAVLMDCQMPVMSGYEAATAIRESETTATHIPVIAMTAHAMPGDREKCLAAGMDDYLTKPLRSAEVRAMLAKWVRSEPPEAPAPHVATQVVPASTSEPLDMAAVDRLREMDDPDDPGFVAELFGAYLEELPNHLAAIRDAQVAGDASTLSRSAHTLKGSSANVGADELRALAFELETLGREGHTADADTWSERLDQAHERLMAALGALPELQGSPLHEQAKSHEDEGHEEVVPS